MKSIQELQIWITENSQKKLSVQDLAERVSMSVRNCERVFTREVGTTPSQYVLQVRVEAGRRQLERTHCVSVRITNQDDGKVLAKSKLWLLPGVSVFANCPLRCDAR